MEYENESSFNQYAAHQPPYNDQTLSGYEGWIPSVSFGIPSYQEVLDEASRKRRRLASSAPILVESSGSESDEGGQLYFYSDGESYGSSSEDDDSASFETASESEDDEKENAFPPQAQAQWTPFEE